MKGKSSTQKLERKCEEVALLMKSLCHPRRLLILGHLIEGEKTVSDLQERCGISQSQLSQFLTRMRLEGLVSCERRGRFQFYALHDERVAALMGAIQRIYCS